jgi:hypothetical protein
MLLNQQIGGAANRHFGNGHGALGHRTTRRAIRAMHGLDPHPEPMIVKRLTNERKARWAQ